ncbi:DUF6878 family protein [Roseitranquillus sediminis]|uniref:DUF6878 family protein n=1 Tax=Roseitranquillus sediminis TaxID=2809051 RepID=UPI001D0CCC87|nr:DUF6878 family protein [Roseitranquillus sediminis]MBM9595097.1 hypothetical protein [Roseitranquillus sediminis]
MTDMTTAHFFAAMERMRADEAAELARTRAELLRSLRSAGVTEFVACYDGCGDSGNIDGMEFQPAGIKPAHETGTRIADFAWSFVHHRHPGFENNEGGFGQLRWDLSDDTISIDHGNRHVEIAYSFDKGL